jgi:hypothetical protein
VEIIEDIFVRKVYKNNEKNLLEVDIFSTNSYGKSSIVTEEGIDDIIEVILPELIGFSILEQTPIDLLLEELTDSSEVRFAFSLATAKASTAFHGLPLYRYIGGMFVKKMPKIVYETTVYDHGMHPLGDAEDLIPLPLDTLLRITKNHPTGGNAIRSIEDGVCHLAVGLGIEYLQIEKKSEINELLRIYEDLQRMEEI